MGIGKILSSGAKTLVNYVKKNPQRIQTAVISGAAGVGGLLLGKALTMRQDKASEFVNHSLLINPVLNPTGCLRHILNPGDDSTNDFDNPLVKSFVNSNKSKYQGVKYLENDNVTRLATYVTYKNNLSKVINADDGGRIELYTNSQNEITGSLNKDKNGHIRNISIRTSDGKTYDINKDDNGKFYLVNNYKTVCSAQDVREFYQNGGKGVTFA